MVRLFRSIDAGIAVTGIDFLADGLVEQKIELPPLQIHRARNLDRQQELAWDSA